MMKAAGMLEPRQIELSGEAILDCREEEDSVSDVCHVWLDRRVRSRISRERRAAFEAWMLGSRRCRPDAAPPVIVSKPRIGLLVKQHGRCPCAFAIVQGIEA